ncbi:hypothetical protein HPB49_014905 [Dermacentor silvarum]|uniref:Uncharacterized protein n=1 Tax=Dermacentor silvarum TaxID=543639 RepID=A0ACB8CLD0_DERSI|nr:uncharacterized protein LOC119455388 [Dermacentor silvarum]KAH7945731.1 hypothetical protein HPB49_014905 [Dermacentor silvarum]
MRGSDCERATVADSSRPAQPSNTSGSTRFVTGLASRTRRRRVTRCKRRRDSDGGARLPMGASGSSTSGVDQHSATANGSLPQCEKKATTQQPAKPEVSKAVRDSVQKSIAASNSLLGGGANGVLCNGVVGGGSAKSYQRIRWSRNSLLARAKLASAVGRAQMHCRRCEHRWTDDGVEVFFDLGRLGVPRVVRKQCFNCGHLVVPSFSCLEWDRLASEALGKWSKKALEAHLKQSRTTGAPLPIPEHCSVPVPDPLTKGMVVINVDVVNNNSPR